MASTRIVGVCQCYLLKIILISVSFNLHFEHSFFTSKFQFDLETVDEEPPRGNATANSLLLLLLSLKVVIIRCILTPAPTCAVGVRHWY